VLKIAKKQQQEMDIERIKKSYQEFCKKAETHIGSQCIELVSKFLVPLGHPVEDIKNTNIDWDNI
jgi:hypothetical protein